MANETMSDFLDGLHASRLLEAERIEELMKRPEPPEGDLDGVSHFLETQGWLTRFQIDEIRRGRGQELQFAGYRLLEKMPDQPSGREFKAYDPKLRQTVVLRLVNADWLRPADDVAGYLERACAASRMSDPNQVNVLDAGLDGETLFIVHEYVDGASLAALVNEMGPLPVELACDYALQAALALQTAHECCIFHGDFSPARMILTPVIRTAAANGTGQSVAARPAPGASIKVEETGLVPRRPPAAQVSFSDSHLLGSAHYLAPERLTSAEPTAKGDLYSLGSSLYFLLAGRPPFAVDSSVDSLMELQHPEAARIDSLRKDVSSALADLIGRLLAKDPAVRPSSVASVVQYLQPFTQFKQAPEPAHVEFAVPIDSQPLPEAEVIDDPTIEPFPHDTSDSQVFSPNRLRNDGEVEHEHHDMFADHGNQAPAKPARPRKKKEKPPKRRWGMIILAIALHVIPIGIAILYFAKLGPFAETKPTYKKYEPAKNKPNR
jgi:eukaryotic-like serine/threonine-protein kinase